MPPVGPSGVRPRHALMQGGRTTRTEIFGPVLTVINVDSLTEAIDLVNRNKCESGRRWTRLLECR